MKVINHSVMLKQSYKWEKREMSDLQQSGNLYETSIIGDESAIVCAKVCITF